MTDQPDHPPCTPSSEREEDVYEAFLHKNYTRACELLREGYVSPAFLRDLLSVSVAAGQHTLAEFLIEQKQVVLPPEKMLAHVQTAAAARNPILAAYLSGPAIRAGIRHADAWRPVFTHAPDKDYEVIISRLLMTAANRQLALDEMFWAATGAKSEGAMQALLGKGANPNVENGLVLLCLVTDPPRGLYDNRANYEIMLDRIFDAGYRNEQMLDIAAMTAVQRFISGGQRVTTALALFRHGADPWQDAEAAQKCIENYYIARSDESAVMKYNQQFDEFRAAEAQNKKQQFERFFAQAALEDLLRPRAGAEDTGLQIAAQARLLPAVMQKFSRHEPRLLQVGHLTRQNARGQSLLTIAADRGDLEHLLNPACWRGIESEVLNCVFANLSKERLEKGGFEKLQSELTRQHLSRRAMASPRLRL